MSLKCLFAEEKRSPSKRKAIFKNEDAYDKNKKKTHTNKTKQQNKLTTTEHMSKLTIATITKTNEF